MKLCLNCLICNVQQVYKVFQVHKIDKDLREDIVRKVFDYLSNEDYCLTAPEIMGNTFKIIIEETGIPDPYEKIRAYYNKLLMEHYDKFKRVISYENQSLYKALKIAAVANIIDFGASHSFEKDDIEREIIHYSNKDLGIDDSYNLFEKLKDAKILVYIGDNCGEIVLDKLFIEEIKKVYPKLKVFFCVRSEPILNDITVKDAEQVKMSECAKVISDGGNGNPGLVLSKSSEEFRNTFHSADVVIAKGQGNYEGLSDVKKDGLFFLLIAKCQQFAKELGVKQMQGVCQENKK